MPLIETKILEYISGKSKKGHDAVKKKIFTDLYKLLIDNQLTVAGLTDKIKNLSPEQRKSLFYSRSKKAEESKAAELIQELYQLMNVSLTTNDMATIVKEGITERTEKILKGVRYKNWLENPTAAREKRDLDHELKDRLQWNSSNNRGKPLAQVLYELWSTKQLPEESLESVLNTIYEEAPDFLPQFLYEAYSLCRTEETSEFLEEVTPFFEENKEIAPYFIKADIDFAIKWIKESPEEEIGVYYFQLPSSMQHEVFSYFKENPKVREAIQNATAEWLFSGSPSKKGKEKGFDKAEEEKIIAILTDPEIRAEEAGNSREYQHVLSLITERHKKEFHATIDKDVQEKAVKGINGYLAKKDSAGEKYQFFQDLRNSIRRNGLSKDLLKVFFNKGQKLLSKPTRAQQLMSDLEKLNERAEKLKTPDEIKKRAHQLFTGERIPQTALDDSILSVIGDLQSKADVLLQGKTQRRQLVEAQYQQYIHQQALELIAKQDKPIFDPQGHALALVHLQENDYQQILKNCGLDWHGSAKDVLEDIIGPVTETIFCNIDVADDKDLSSRFNEWLDRKESDFFEEFKDDRGSIIALQEEMSVHVFLALRVLQEKVFPGKLNLKIGDDFRQELMEKINQRIQNLIQKAMEECDKAALDEPSIDKVALLNKIMDEARLELAQACREDLVDTVLERVEDEKDEIIEQLASLKKHDFTSKTATGLDYLRNDVRNQTIVRITATDETAHDKKIGHQAIRVLNRNHYRSKEVRPYHDDTSEARVPSIAVGVDENVIFRMPGTQKREHQQAIDDVVQKLKESRALMQKMRPDYHGPMTYNLLTSLHGKAKDILPKVELQNRQRKSAARIFKGSHVYNRELMEKGNSQGFTFVQNIPVNQHGEALNDNDMDKAVREATLLTNMAMLATLRHHAAKFSPAMQKSLEETYQQSQKLYQAFLASGKADGTHYFSSSKEGEDLIKILNEKKAEWKENKPLSARGNLSGMVVKTLFNMYSQNAHYNKQFGMLIQALSVFVEPMSEAGCKSANERYQAVSGRVELLKSISSRKWEELSEAEQDLVLELDRFAVEGGGCEKLQECMDVAYNLYNLQGSVASISEEDQAASSKIKSSKNKANEGVISEYNTNVAETSRLTRLSQKNSSSMQSHKAELSEVYRDLFGQKMLESLSDLAMK
ncbi:hypothetical protein [Legionella israelensis]|uniref:Uncharacterized protein n=1 Tax=Legionella israelensis TaxID=454 RepID=A0A0W0W183_9GAMM|nr:hypothetical protein [Legionella israelensis]KTD26058.1 hypothetical protein Lisr_1199 [Legionella israelensis]QBS10152.1 hypothetical protein E4T55_09970 [Legionella israelensis]SCY26552.1 hypothetical protein SAMN02746069_01831 [Legionella israelensis DSM 19235]STX59742.1 Uncharacterised protein [Legionella israelensis]